MIAPHCVLHAQPYLLIATIIICLSNNVIPISIILDIVRYQGAAACGRNAQIWRGYVCWALVRGKEHPMDMIGLSERDNAMMAY
jgi:hypothetical protein